MALHPIDPCLEKYAAEAEDNNEKIPQKNVAVYNVIEWRENNK